MTKFHNRVKLDPRRAHASTAGKRRVEGRIRLDGSIERKMFFHAAAIALAQ